jgi:predicted carbohydrate-binding protein with CBM48
LADYEETLERVVQTLREPVQIDPDVDRRVMADIAQIPQAVASTSSVRPMRAWLRQRWTVRLSPLGGLAAAAALATLLIAGGRLLGPRTDTPAGADARQDALTQFVLVAPQAATVTLVGDFNDWSPSATPLTHQAGDGVWWVSVPLQPGRYRYAFLVDGTSWQGDPNAPSAGDEFGRPNSVVTIGG